MKITQNDLYRIDTERNYPVDMERYDVDNVFLKRLEKVSGYITFYYDIEDKLVIDYSLSGTMICPCAVSLEDVEVPFELSDNDLVTFKDGEEGFYVRDGISLEELVYEIVFPEVPIKVVKKEKIVYSSGDGWAFVSEEDFRNERIDPRLAKLKEYKFEEEE